MRALRMFLLILLTALGSSVLAQPTNEDLGTLAAPGVSRTRAYAAREVKWFKITLNQEIRDRYLDIDTEGTGGFGSDSDTMIALYRSNGTVVSFDDDDASGFLSQLSFGTLAAARPGLGGLEYDGRDGDLPAGVYYIAVTGFSATFAGNFTATTNSNRTGNVVLNVRTDIGAGRVLHPQSITVIEGFYFNGNLSSILDSDNVTYGLLNDFDTLAAEVEIVTDQAAEIANRLQFSIEVATTRPYLVQTISLRNYESAKWDTWFGGFAPQTDTTYNADITSNPSRYRSASGELKCRVRWTPLNDEDPAQDAWLLSIDSVEWIIDGQ